MRASDVGEVVGVSSTALAEETPSFLSSFGHEQANRQVWCQLDKPKANERGGGPIADHSVGTVPGNDDCPSGSSALRDGRSQIAVTRLVGIAPKNEKADAPEGVPRARRYQCPFDRAGIGLFRHRSRACGAVADTIAVRTLQGLRDGTCGINRDAVFPIVAALLRNCAWGIPQVNRVL